MANKFIVNQLTANKLLLDFENALGITKFAKHEYDSKFGNAGAQIGDEILLRDAVQLTVGDGEVITPQSIEQKTRALRLNIHKHVAWETSIKEQTLSVQDWMKWHGSPSVKRLAAEVDRIVMRLAAIAAGSFVGTVDTDVSAFRTFGDAREQIENLGAPDNDDMLMLINARTQNDAVTLSSALFNSQSEISEQYKNGNMGRHAGFNWHRTNNVYRHTVGPLGGTPLVDGAQTGSSILTKGWTAAAANRLKQGDAITFGSATAGVFKVNPITKVALPDLYVARAAADVDSDAAGAATIPLTEELIATGPYQNVSRALADDDTIQIFGHASSYASKTTAMNLAMHPDAVVFAMAPLYVPKNLDFGGMQYDKDTGLAISFARDFEIRTHKLITRIDVLAGAAVTHRDWISNVLAK